MANAGQLRQFAGAAGPEAVPAGGKGDPYVDEMDAALTETHGEQAPGGTDDDLQEEGDGRFGQLIPMLEHYHDELLNVVADIGDAEAVDIATAPDDETNATIAAGFEALPEDLQEEMVSALSGGITEEEAHGLADHLADEGMADQEDTIHIAGWLFHLAAFVEELATPGEEEDSPEDLGEDDQEDLDDTEEEDLA